MSSYTLKKIGLKGLVIIFMLSVLSGLALAGTPGTVKWSFETGGGVNFSPAIGTDGTIYVGSLDRKLYAINPDGTAKWSFQTGLPVHSSPAIAPDGSIYVGSLDRKLYAINPDGTEKWSFQTGLPVHSSPAIGPDGTIYVGSDGLYAIYSDSHGLADSSWPMFHHDLRHTGRAEQTQMPGDCNGDGTVSIDEIQKSINCFLGKQNACCDKCDLNSNGKVSIDEVQKVINAYLGK